jgi:hypothetical protein
LNLNRCWHICVDTDREKFLQRSAIVAATSPTVIFPSVTAIKLLSAAESLSHSIDSVQPPTIYTAGCRLGKRQYSDTTAIITIKTPFHPPSLHTFNKLVGLFVGRFVGLLGV